jgi:minor extracellular serine protease Vpr
MKTLLKLLLLPLLFFFSYPSFSQDLPKLSASTQQYLWKQKNLYQGKNKILNECVYRTDNNGRVYLATLIQVSPAINQNDLANLDIKIGSESKDIWTAYVPLENVEAFTQLHGIKCIEIDRPSGMDMDSARLTTHADSVHAGINLPQAYTGKNVVVGIIDIGFDYTHPANFDTSYSQYRVKRVWEQKAAGTPPSGFSFGAEFTDSLSIWNKQTDNTGQSHGAHVMGIAAGSGYGTTNGDNEKYRGMAYESDIVYVGILPDTSHWLNTGYTDFLDGMNYIFDYATSVGKPAVANLSWGPPIGPHDGDGLFSQGCDNATGPGKIFCISAGNNRGKKVHVQKIFSPSDTIVNTFLTFSSSLTEKRNWADVWGDTSQVFGIQFSLYFGTTLQTVSQKYYIDNQTHQINLVGSNGDTCFITLTAVTSDVNGKSHMLIDAYTRTSNMLMISVFDDQGKVDMWQGYVLGSTGIYAAFSKNNLAIAVDGDDAMACSDAASTRSAIAVAAYNSKVSYINLSGSSINAVGETYGEITSFSSPGPAADGRTKPNITGPGSRIVASINSYSTVYNSLATDQYVSVLDGRTYKYGALQGTSMSCPAVTGIVALMLEADPTLTPDQVKVLMYNTAILDTFTGIIPSYGDFDWGFGKINAYAAVRATLSSAGIYHDENSLLNAFVYPNPNNGNYAIEIFSANEDDYQLSVTDLNGKMIHNEIGQLHSGTNTFFINTNFASGIYLVMLKTGAGIMKAKVVVE